MYLSRRPGAPNLARNLSACCALRIGMGVARRLTAFMHQGMVAISPAGGGPVAAAGFLARPGCLPAASLPVRPAFDKRQLRFVHTLHLFNESCAAPPLSFVQNEVAKQKDMDRAEQLLRGRNAVLAASTD